MADVTKIELRAIDNASGTIATIKTAAERLNDSLERMRGLSGILGTLGAGLSVGFFTALARGTFEAMDRLAELSKTTRVAAADLSGLGFAMRTAGGDLESGAAAIDKLATNMGKGAEKFAALGVNARDPIEAFKQLADVTNAIADPQMRAAVLAEALGKSWEKAAPLLAEGSAKIGELVDEGKRLSGITQESTQAANDLNEKIIRLIGNGGLLNATVGAALPLLNQLADTLLKIRERGDGANAFATAFAEALRVMIVLGGNVAFVFRGMGTEIGGLAAQLAALAHGDFARFAEIGRQMKADAEANRRAFDDWEKKIMSVGTTAVHAASQLESMDQVQRRMQQDAEAQARAFLEAEKRKADAARLQAEMAREAERLRKDDIAGWVRYADAVFDEADRLNLDMAKIWDDFWAREGKLRDDDIAGWIKHIDAMTEEYEKGLREIADKQPAMIQVLQKQWLQMWTPIAEAAGTFFGDLVVNGRSAFDNLRHSLKQLLADMIALFAKRWILQVAAGGTMAGAASGAFASDGSGSLANSALSLVGSSASTYLFGSSEAIGVSAPGVLGAGGFASTAGAWAGSAATAVGAEAATAATIAEGVAAAIPVIGWVIAIAGILYSIFGHKGGGPKAGGAFLGTFGTGGDLLGNITGTLDRSQHLQNEAQLDSTAQQIGTSLATTIAHTITQLGGTSQAFQLGVGFNRDPAGTAPSMASILLRDATGRTLFEQANRDVGRGDGQLEAEMALQGQRALLAALQASELPNEIAGIINSLVAESASSDDIQRILAAAVDMKNVLDHIGEIHLKGLDVEALKAWQRDGETLSQTMQRVGTAIAQFDDAFMTDAQKIAAARNTVQTVFGDLGVAIPQSSEDFYTLVHSIDVSTEAGRHMVEMLLQVGPAFQTVEQATQQAIAGMYSAAASLSASFGQQFASANLRTAAQHWIDVSGTPWSVDQVINEIGGLIGGGTASNPGGFNDALAFVQTLGPEAMGVFTQLLQAYQSWQQAMGGAAGTFQDFTSTIADVGNAAEDARNQLRGYIDSLLLNDQLSPLSPMERLGAARTQYEQLLALAQTGDSTAIGQLSGASDTYLRIAREIFASSSAYVDIFNQVMNGLTGVAGYRTDWQSSLVSALPVSSPIASQADIQQLTFALRDYLGAVAKGNSAEMTAQNSILKKMVDVQTEDAGRR